jgi:hypothetical protein
MRVLRESVVRGGDLNRRSAIKFSQFVKGAIIEGKYTYAPYSKEGKESRYEKWKRENYPTGKHKALSGDMLRAITFFQSSGGWVGGIKAGVMDSGGKSWFGTRANPKGTRKEIAKYARVGEFGGSFGEGGTHPERPLFQNATKDFRRVWLREADKTMEKMKDAWSTKRGRGGIRSIRREMSVGMNV